jgi:hypothetical protein
MPGQPLEGPVLDLIPQVRNAVTASSKFQFSTDSPPLHDGYGLEGLPVGPVSTLNEIDDSN